MVTDILDKKMTDRQSKFNQALLVFLSFNGKLGTEGAANAFAFYNSLSKKLAKLDCLEKSTFQPLLSPIPEGVEFESTRRQACIFGTIIKGIKQEYAEKQFAPILEGGCHRVESVFPDWCGG